MIRYCRLRFMLSLILVFLACTVASAKSGQEHVQQWNDVFGVRDSTSRINIQPLWKVAQDVIDGVGEDYRDLQNRFTWFKWGSLGHRLLFHWGFNANPQNYAPLVRQVRLCLKGNPDARNQERQFFAYLTRNIQAPRNQKLINAVTSVTGIPTARGYANAVATILYDVHLLGDYTTTNTSALPKIDDIESDLVGKGFNRLLAGGDKSERLKKIEAELLDAIRVGRGRVNSACANNLSQAVRKYLPQILNERFSKTSGAKGITYSND